LKRIFWENEVSIEAEEIVSTKRTILKLSSGKKLKLSAEFEYSENVIREYGTVSFLVTDLPLQDEEMLDEFLKTPESFYCVLIPNTESKKHLALLSKSNKRFAMMLNDDITELDYKLSSNYTEDRLSRSIREIVGTFYSAAFFIVDEKSDLYESKKFAFIEKQFKKRGIVLVTNGKMESIKASTFQLENDFHDFMSSLKKDDEKVLMVSAENYLTISTLIPSYRKIGYKFIYPGDIIIKR
jgi:hypothetical protein